MTVNKALSQLAKSGLIERRRRSGSFVTRPRSQAAILEIHDIKREVQALGRPYRYELAARIVRRATAADRQRFDVAAASSLVELSCRHFAGKKPFCLEKRLDQSRRGARKRPMRASPTSRQGHGCIGRVPWSAAEHTIRATAATPETAAALDIAEGSPCLVVERRTWSADQPVTLVTLTYAGDSHALVATFAPS